MKYECQSCGISFDFEKKDFKSYVFGKKGETFTKTEIGSQNVKLFGNKVAFHSIQFQLLEDLKFNGLKCPLCNKVNWFIKELISNPISLKESGWYILKYAPKLINVKEIDREIEEYKISRYKAKENLINQIAENVLKDIKK